MSSATQKKINRILLRVPIAFSFFILILLAAPVSAGTLMVWGIDSTGITDAPEGEFRLLAQGGAAQGLAIREDRTFELWGGLGDRFAIPSDIPEDLVDATVVGACMGRTHAVLILQDKSLASWGLANPTGDPAVPPGRFREVGCGNRHTIALTLDGTLDGWGSNDVNQLAMPEGKFKAVAVRVVYSLALRTDGTLIGWGLSPIAPNLSPGVFATWSQQPGDSIHFFAPGRYKSIAAGNNHAIAIRNDGTVAGWGFNSGGPNSGNPLQAPEGVRFKEIAAGVGFSVGIDTDGKLWGWGTPGTPPPPFPQISWSFETEGWTRYDDAGHYYIPDQVFKSVSAGAFHVAAITDDGDIEPDDE